MTFETYWREKGHFGSTPEEVAKLAWDAAMLEAVSATADEDYELCARCGGAIAKENDYCVTCDMEIEDAEVSQLRGESV